MSARIPFFAISLMLLGSPALREAAAPPSSSAGQLIVVNQKEHTLLVVDPDARRELAKISVGVNGHEVILSKDSRYAYVPIYGNSGVGRPGTDGSTIDVIDLQARKLTTTIDLGKPLRPHCAKMGPDGLLYVTAELDNAISVIDPSAGKVLGEIPTGEPQSHMLVLSADGHRGYTANVSAGTVSVLDVAQRKLITTIPVSKSVQRISISPDGKRVYTHDQSAPRIAVIDVATNKVSNWIELPDVAYASAATPDGKWLISISMSGNHLHVIDTQSWKVVRSLDIPQGSSEILIRPGGQTAYVSGTGAGKIAVVDLKNWTVEAPIEMTPGVDGLAWASASN